MSAVQSGELRSVRPVAPSHTVLTPLGLREVTLAPEGFWGIKRRVNEDASLEHCLFWQTESGWVGNFDAAAAGTLPGARQGREFADSEIYKLLEAMSWQVGTNADPAAEATIIDLTARIAAAQEPDGYLNTNFGRAGQAPRYSDLAWGHELYNFGHLLQAAVARARTVGPDPLLDVAIRVADHVCRTFGPDGIQGICGHPEIELGLIELGRYTGNSLYIAQAALFVERRGHQWLPDIEYGRSYYQDDIPVRSSSVLRGHAVRALYLAAAAVDVAVETEDAELLAALELQWASTVAARTYITGGMGSHHQDEAFGDDFELPSDRAYCETCASVASVMFSWRLLLATGNPRYADLIERTLFNVVATSPAPDGRSFFYANTLHQRVPSAPADPHERSPRAVSTMRAPWFDVSCCPSNVARLLASLSSYVATTTSDGLQVHLYGAGEIGTMLGDGRQVGLRVVTDYPTGGEIGFEVTETPDTVWSLGLRVPEWSETSTVTVNGEAVAVSAGMTTLTREFAVGDVIVLTLDVSPRITSPDRRVDAIRGTAAIEAGPLVYCLESIDLPDGVELDDVALGLNPPVLRDGSVFASAVRSHVDGGDWPYAPGAGFERTEWASFEVRLVPYYQWATRGPSTMRVWVPTKI